MAAGLASPVANTRLYVLGRDGEPTPIGVPGELFVGGAGVARGYPDDPARTAARFVPDPFSARPGARLYRTGLRVRRLADGALVPAAADEPKPSAARPSRPYTAPGTAVEHRLAAGWAELLGVAQVGVDDNFFALGGNSLLAMMAVARAQEEFHVEVPATSLFQHPTVAGFAAVVEDAGTPAPAPRALPPTALPRAGRTLADLLAELESR